MFGVSRRAPALFLLGVLALSLSPVSAAGAGLLELRVGGVLVASDPDDLGRQLEAAGLDAGSLGGYNLDIVVNIPLLPISAGLRWEKTSQDAAASGSGFELDVKDVSVLVDWRILDNSSSGLS